jgi:membrane protein implicated in regulation of membrane protease activity
MTVVPVVTVVIMAVVVTATLISVAVMSAVVVATFMAISLITTVITPAFTIAISAVGWSRVSIASVVCWRRIVRAMLNYHVARKSYTDSDVHLCTRLRRCNQGECHGQTE